MGTRTLGLLAVGAVTLAGCTGGGEDPETSSTSIATPTSASSSTPSTPSSSGGSSTGSGRPTARTVQSTAPPVQARPDSQAGAEAFAKWYWEALAESVTVGDTAVPRKYSTRACSMCRDSLDAVQAKADKYGVPASNPYTVKMESSEFAKGRSFVKLDVAFDDYTLEKNGEPRARIKGDASKLILEVRHDGETWKAQKWTLLR